MPKRSPFVIQLTEEDRAELEARCEEYTSPYRDIVRAKIVLLASEGLGNDRIAAQLGMPRQIASKWRQRFCIDRLPGLDDRPRGGRPVRFSPQCRGRDQGIGLRIAVTPWSALDSLVPSPNCVRRRWPAASSPRSAVPRFGAGWARAHYAPGAIVAGSFPVTRKAGQVIGLYQRGWKGAARSRALRR